MARDLSPYSARKLLTQKIASGDTVQSDSGSPSRDRFAQNGSDRGRQNAPIPSRPRQRSQSREEKRATSLEAGNLSNKPQDAGTDRNRGHSPEPYRKPRKSSKERKRSGSRDRRRTHSSDRRRDRSRNRKDDDRKEGRRNRSSDRPRDDISRDKDTDRRRRRPGSEEDYKRRERSRSRDRRQKEKAKHRRRSRSRARSPTAPRSRKQRTRSASSSASPPPKRRRRSRSRSRSKSPPRRAKKPLPSQEVSFRGLDDSTQAPSKYGGAPVNKEKPNFKTTGALAKHANRVEGTKISLKYHEPAEARKPPPSQPWRIFVFKGDDVVDTMEIWQKSCWLLGRSHEVVDYVLEHPSSSGQHAVIQFRYIQKTVEDEFGVKSKKGKVKPYVIDLESSNGTELNGEAVEASRYFELRDKDILRFAGSEREYVIMLPPPDEK